MVEHAILVHRYPIRPLRNRVHHLAVLWIMGHILALREAKDATVIIPVGRVVRVVPAPVLDAVHFHQRAVVLV